jgi:RNA polymerase sigma-70 factor, ECF subfamily
MYSLSVPKENEWLEQNSSEAEIQRLMVTYGNDVLRTSYMFLKDYHKAEDAYQEVFIKVYKKLDSFKGNSTEKTWIIKITINVCKDILRSSWIRRVLLTDKVDEGVDNLRVEDKIIKMDEDRRLFEGVIALSQSHKEIVILFYYQDFNTEEISRILNIAEGTVRSRLHRAREALKNNLEGRVEWNG